MAEQSLLMQLGLADYNARLKQWVLGEINELSTSMPEGSATQEWVETRIAELVNSAPETLDTLNELAEALGNDPNFATTVTTQLGQKATKAELNALIGGTLHPDYDTVSKIATELGRLDSAFGSFVDTEITDIRETLDTKATKAELNALIGGTLPEHRDTMSKLSVEIDSTQDSISELYDTKANKSELSALTTAEINSMFTD